MSTTTQCTRCGAVEHTPASVGAKCFFCKEGTMREVYETHPLNSTEGPKEASCSPQSPGGIRTPQNTLHASGVPYTHFVEDTPQNILSCPCGYTTPDDEAGQALMGDHTLNGCHLTIQGVD